MTTLVESAPAVTAPRAGQPGAGSWVRRLPLVPALVFTFIVTQIPFLLTLWYSFQKYNLNYPTAAKQFPTLYNYRAIFHDHCSASPCSTRSLLTIAPVLLSVAFGVGIAVLLNRHVFGRGFLRTLIISPFLVMSTAAALVWKFTILDTSFGILNWFLKPFGLGHENWIGVHPQLTIIAFLTWQWTPFMVLLALAGLQSQGDDQLEAARVDGAGSWRIFRSLTHAAPAALHRAGRAARLDLHRAGLRLDLHHHRRRPVDRHHQPALLHLRGGVPGVRHRSSPRRWQSIVVIATIVVATLALRMVSSLFSDEGMRGR